MTLACHGPLAARRPDPRATRLDVSRPWREAPQIALAGNPNVGKSTVFNSLTGRAVLTANYPGTTVEVTVATLGPEDHPLTLLDLPGTYALSGRTADQAAVRRLLLEDPPDAVIAVLDATNLARNLYLVLQLLDLGFPLVVALNLGDEAARRGIRIDAARLADRLGVPVVPTIATRGCGMVELLSAARAVVGRRPPSAPRYSRALEALAARAAVHLDGGADPRLDARGLALLALEEGALSPGDLGVPTAVFREPAAVVIARQRHRLAERIARGVTLQRSETLRRGAWHLATRPATGVPILFAVLAALFGVLFWGGGWLARLVEGAWGAAVSPALVAAVERVAGPGVLSRTLLWGLDAGLLAVLTIGIPYVLTFYLLLSVLEDTGCLSAAAVLADRVLSPLGLTGRAAIPLVAGAGCSVPAILGLRALRTERERLIAGTLVALTPCSARTAVILGAAAAMGGWPVALALYGLVAVLIAGVGWGINRLLPGRPPDLLMEIFPFRRPHVRAVLRKAWLRGRQFVTVAVPVVFAGSLVLGALYETGLIRLAERPLAPVVEGWLRLPAVAGLTLVFAVLRKELALQLLVALAVARYGAGAGHLAAFMTPVQVFTYALVNTLYIPCVATMAVLARALGWRRAVWISASTVTLALVAGGVAARAAAWLGL